MKRRYGVIFLAFLTAMGICLAASTAISEEIVVTTMSIDAFDNIMADKNCRCMVVAMAAWCSPCRKELPVLNRLYEKYKNEGLSLIGVSVDAGGPNVIQPIITKSHVTFPVYWVGEDAVRKYKIFGIPMIFLIKNGKIIEKIPGQRPEDYLEEKIKKFLMD
jgi:thiol-disulfide isomerase/thioredoxin